MFFIPFIPTKFPNDKLNRQRLEARWISLTHSHTYTIDILHIIMHLISFVIVAFD